MELKNIKAAAVVVRTIRDDWNPRTIEAQLTEMADNWPHADVLYAAVMIASDMSNQFPATLSMKAGKVLERLHTKTATIRTHTGSSGRKGFLCDVCSKTESECQNAITNIDGVDHPFISATAGQAERERQTAGREAARLEAIEVARRSLTKPVPDIDQPTHPEPEQESA
jgi:hypothetical protein